MCGAVSRRSHARVSSSSITSSTVVESTLLIHNPLFHSRLKTSGVSTRGTGGRVPQDFRPRGQSCKSPLNFLTHNNAIVGFTSQSLGLAAYACKTDSSTAINLALRMHINVSFWAQKSKTNLWGEDIATSPHPSQVGRGTLHPHTHPFGALFFALAMIRPPLLNRVYALA